MKKKFKIKFRKKELFYKTSKNCSFKYAYNFLKIKSKFRLKKKNKSRVKNWCR